MSATLLRYTMPVTPAGEWKGFGERSAGGQAWTQFFGMTPRPPGD